MGTDLIYLWTSNGQSMSGQRSTCTHGNDSSCSMLDLLEDFMELRAIPYARLDGSTTRPRRNLDIKLVCVNRIARHFKLSLLSLSVPTREIA